MLLNLFLRAKQRNVNSNRSATKKKILIKTKSVNATRKFFWNLQKKKKIKEKNNSKQSYLSLNDIRISYIFDHTISEKQKRNRKRPNQITKRKVEIRRKKNIRRVHVKGNTPNVWRRTEQN